MHRTLKLSFALVCAARVTARQFTVVNSCPVTLWPAIFTDMTVGTAVPNFTTGWQANSGTSVSFSVPDNWTAGRIWARQDCDFNNATLMPPHQCVTGGCLGGLMCDASGAGVPPATLAEWTLSGDGNRDFYDVSVVDGFNIPMRIDNSVGCPIADCAVNLDPICPSSIQGPFNSSGAPVGCNSACQANLDGNQANSPNCCSGSFDTPATCPNSSVQFYSFFKGNCPNSYAYAFDESSNTALWTCDSGLNADYTLTFCPSSNAANASISTSSSGLQSTSTSPGTHASTTSTTGSTALPDTTTSAARSRISLRLFRVIHIGGLLIALFSTCAL